MRTVKHKIYSFSELSEESKEKAISNVRDNENYLSYDWWDSVYEDFRQIAKITGIYIADIYFSGFSSQGDGACFTGAYAYKSGALKELKKYAPKDEKLHAIVKSLQEVQSKYFYKLSAQITHNGRYYHSNSVSIDVLHENENVTLPYTKNYRDDTGIDEALRGLMEWLYSTLEKEYDYLMSDEAVIEHVEANELEFWGTGRQF